MNPIEQIQGLAKAKHEVFLSTAEIAMISAALGGLGQEITKRMSGADAEQVSVLAAMLADSKKLENRLDALLESVVGDTLSTIASALAEAQKEGEDQ